MRKYHVASPAAIVGGVAAAGGAIALLVRDALTTGWTVDLALMPVLVGLTVLAAHHVGKALRSGKIVAVVGLLLLAGFGSSLTVYETMGRRAEVKDAKVATATMDAAERQRLTQRLAEAEEILAEHRTSLAAECGSGKGKKCTGLAYTVETWEKAVKGYQADLRGLGAPAPVDPKGERIAAFAALLGISTSAADVMRIVRLLDPLTLPLFLELGAIVLFGYGFGRGREVATEAVKTASPVVTDKPVKTALTFERPLTPAEIEELRKLLLEVGRPLNNNQLAAALGVSPGEASKRVSEGIALGVLRKARAGREVQITTVH